MGWLIDKIRSWFCIHEWELLWDNDVEETYYGRTLCTYHNWIYVCKKCGRRKKITSK